MSTDLRDRPADPSPDEEAKEKPKSSLSFTQVVGGALAAMTAAALGSRLSVAGTVLGAALASVVAAVAGAIYTSSLRHTTRTVSTVIRTRRTSSSPDAPAPTWDEDAGVVESTTVDTVNSIDVVGAPDTADVTPDAPGQPASAAQPPRRRIRWKTVVVAALLMFAVAAVALTGIELATGHALSGGTGTTVGHVAERQSDPSPSPTRKSTPSPSASPTASSEPSATPSSAPSTAPTPKPTPKPTLSQTAAPEPSTTPAPSSAPTTSASSVASPRVGPSAGAGSTP